MSDIAATPSGTQHAARVLHEANKKAIRQVLHPGHEHLHAVILLCLIVIIVVLQSALYYWKRKYTRAFKRVTLAGVAIVPVLFSLYFGFWRFIVSWVLFIVLSGRIVRAASRRPLEKSTPRTVYRFFVATHRISYATAGFGYALVMAEVLGVSLVAPAVRHITELGIVLIFYGLYYGLLCTDLAEICSEKLANTMGLQRPKSKTEDDGGGGGGGGGALPTHALSSAHCSICTQALYAPKRDTPLLGSGGDGEGGAAAATAEFEEHAIALHCGHRFHESCVRGWVIVGKNDTCPACNEKVSLNEMLGTTHAWLETSVLWRQCLDALRYLLVWNPMILTVVQVFVYMTDHD